MSANRVGARAARFSALYTDRHPQSEFRVRNLARKAYAFWLQTARDKFYPGFVARLKGGRTLVKEYKRKTWAEFQSEQDKLIVGQTRADAREGRCIFATPAAKGFAGIDSAIRQPGG